MYRAMTALMWTLIAGVVVVGIVGSVLNTAPVTGLLVVPFLALVLMRHGRTGLLLLLGGLSGRLPIESWHAAHEVAEGCRRDILLAALPAVVFSLLQLSGLSASQLLAGTGHAALPLLLAFVVRSLVLTPLSAHLRMGHERWVVALKEALTLPVQRPSRCVDLTLAAPRRTVA